jgi:hypothetical protein
MLNKIAKILVRPAIGAVLTVVLLLLSAIAFQAGYEVLGTILVALAVLV